MMGVTVRLEHDYAFTVIVKLVENVYSITQFES